MKKIRTRAYFMRRMVRFSRGSRPCYVENWSVERATRMERRRAEVDGISRRRTKVR